MSSTEEERQMVEGSSEFSSVCGGYRLCKHGQNAGVFTSWSYNNPGRRLLGCKMWKDNDCHFFEWLDPEDHWHTKTILRKLIAEKKVQADHIKALEERLEVASMKEATLSEKVVILEKRTTLLEDEMHIYKVEGGTKVQSRNCVRRMVMVVMCFGLFLFAWFIGDRKNGDQLLLP